MFVDVFSNLVFALAEKCIVHVCLDLVCTFAAILDLLLFRVCSSCWPYCLNTWPPRVFQ